MALIISAPAAPARRGRVGCIDPIMADFVDRATTEGLDTTALRTTETPAIDEFVRVRESV